MKVVINECYGGFRLSTKAYEQLIEWGVPVRKYVQSKPDEGEVIFDCDLTPASESLCAKIYWKYRDPIYSERYWDIWTRANRSHPLVIRVVEELGEAASSRVSDLRVVEVPDGVDFTIEEYDGNEHIAEAHRKWR